MSANQFDNLNKTFAKYVSANIMGMVGISFYILADTLFIAKGIGTDGLAALNLALPIFSLIHGIGVMVAMGSATKYSILRAMGQDKQANRFFTQAFWTTVMIGILFLLGGVFFSRFICQFLGSKGEIIGYTDGYLKTIMVFTPMFSLNHLFICFVRNDGNPRLAMHATLWGSFVNIIFDYIFIFPMQLGMFGAALATGMAPIVGIIITSFHAIRKKNKYHFVKGKYDMSISIDTLKLGFSSFINEMSSGIVIFIFNWIILRIAGTIGVAAYGVIANTALVFTSLFTGLGQGIQPLISHYYGTRDHEKVKKTLHYAIITAFVLSMLSYVVIVVFKVPLVALFNEENNREMAMIAELGVVLYFIGLIPCGCNVVSVFYLNSREEAVKGLTISILRGFVFITLSVAVLAVLWGMTGVWLAFPCAEIATALVAFYILRKQKKMQ